MCESLEVGRRIFAAASNVVLLVPVVYCLLRGPRRTIAEIITFTATAVISSLYHMCDWGDACSQICVADWHVLYNLDFIFSYQMFPTAISYSLDCELTIYKMVFLVVSLVCNIAYALSGQPDDGLFYGLMALAAVVTTVIRFVYLWRSNKLNDVMYKHFDLKMGIVALTFAIAGVLFKTLTPFVWTEYAWLHGMWHITIALAMTFMVSMYDPRIWCNKHYGKKFQDDGTEIEV